MMGQDTVEDKKVQKYSVRIGNPSESRNETTERVPQPPNIAQNPLYQRVGDTMASFDVCFFLSLSLSPAIKC